MDPKPAESPWGAPQLVGGVRARRGPRGPRGQRQPPQGRPYGGVACGPPGRKPSGASHVDAPTKPLALGGVSSLQSLLGQVAVLSKTADGCRRVQGALKSALKPDQKAIVHELKGHVCELLESPHGNHVLQLAVELLPPDAVDFVCSEILQRWSAADLARQPYGCRVLERLIEHFPRGRLECALRDILGNVETLSGDQYGNFVIQHLLEHGDDAQRRHIAGVVRQNPALFVHGVSACGVLDKILTYGSWNDQVDIAERIVAQEPLLATMAASAHGFASTQRLFTIAAHARACPAAAGGGLLEAACRQLLEPPALDRMMASRHGQSLLSEIIPPGYGGAQGALARSRPGVVRSRG